MLYILTNFKSILTFIILTLFIVVGCYLRLEIWFELEFIFSSIAAIIAIYLLGLFGAVAMVLLSGLFCLADPHYFALMLLEIIFIGLTWRKISHNLLILDIIFWLILGLPLLWLAHSQLAAYELMGLVPLLFIRFLNGISNTLVAGLIISLVPFRYWYPINDYPSLRYTLFNMLILFTLLPVVMVLNVYNWHIGPNLPIEQLQAIYWSQIIIISTVFVLGFVLAMIASYTLIHPLIRLSKVQFSSPDNPINQVPDSHLQEIHGISLNFINLCQDMMQRKNSEQRLQNSQAMLKTILDNIPQCIFWKDSEGRYLGCNQNFAHTIGIAKLEQIVGHTDADLVKNNANRDILASLGKCASKRSPCYHCTSHIASYEYNLWFDTNVIPLYDPKGKYLGYLGTLEDISERKQTEEKLKQAAQVLKNSAEAICITNADAKIIVINRAFSQITGYQEYEVLGKGTNILKSGKHDDNFYKEMWFTIESKGHWEGEIWNRRKNGEIYPEWLNISVIRDENTQEITNYLAIFSDITRIKQNEQRLAYLAHYDDLTGLPNRTLFYERLERALFCAQQDGNKVGVLFLDLDHFKYVNDTWGHAVGDLLLKDVAKRILACVGKHDTIARIGGDEFTAVLDKMQAATGGGEVSECILEAMRPAFYLNGHETFISTSIGISIYPDDGTDVETLLKHADTAMYRAKENGKNNYQFFTPQMNVNAKQRMLMEGSLRHAVERGELRLFYQPQIHLASGHIVGAEALLRWQHPELGLLSPQQFIPLAEETGLIVSIGEWVLRTACEQHKLWRASGFAHLRLAVNLSARQFRAQYLAESIIQILQQTQMDPCLLELEITESVLMKDADRAVDTLYILKAMGVNLAIDDFGTGYSSLNYLKRFPIDKLKIDKSFICDIPHSSDDMTITKAIVALARSLRLKVIAEGVETKAQLAFLKSLRCDEVQGYLTGHPIPVSQFMQLLQENNLTQLKRA
jgi:diguanylate cyclase (GGDEF)-like protein/PAS domain S-box-containing protein